MKEKGLVEFFENYLEKKPIFKNKQILQSNFLPEKIFHREEQINQIAKILAPSLKGEKISNLFIYGKTGTGKTATTKHIISQIEKTKNNKNILLKIIYINCKLKKVADTEYRLIAQLAREFGKAIPPTGLPTDEVYNSFFSALDKEKQNIIIVLDEIDQLIGKVGDEILYNLTRVNSELLNSQVSIIGISNDIMFIDNLDPRVKSSLSEEEIIFPPYNALQIQTILSERAKESFNNNILEEGFIEKCAAFAARDHGDARRAIELLRVAGEIAEREGNEFVKINHLDEAEEKIEKDRVFEIIQSQPKQYQVVLFSILQISDQSKSSIFTGEIYEFYKNLCVQAGLRPLTQRRISDIIGEFDMLGIINAKVISKGRYGRTREISIEGLNLNEKIKQTIQESLGL